MDTQTRQYPRGMTLIELLVVVALLAAIAVTVLPNLAATTEDRRSREAARIVSTFIAKAQARAVGRSEWSGFMLVASNPVTSYAAIDFMLADVPPPYRGDTVPALLTLTGTPVLTGTVTGTMGQLSMAMVSGVGPRRADLIRFNGVGPFFEIETVTGTSIVFKPRGQAVGAQEDAGYQPHNTPWPPSTVPLSFEVVGQPVPAGSPMSLGEGRAVDLYWSGCGPPELTVGGATFSGTSTPYRPFSVTPTGAVATAGASTSVLFDGTGRLRQVICTLGPNVQKIPVTGPVYLLVGRADRVSQMPAALNPDDDSVGANWQYPDSYWLAIDPATGVVKTAECMPNASGATAIDQCVNSQAWVRRSLLGNNR